MSKNALVSEVPQRPTTSPCTNEIEQYAQEWLLNAEYEQRAASTISTRRIFINNLVWFLRHRDFEECGTRELRQFFYYLHIGHEEPGGRWGNPKLVSALRPITIKDYYVCLRVFFGWLIKEEIIEVSPLSRVERPQVREEIKQPLTMEQTEALLRAARASSNPLRNEALLLMLFDSGVRASELISIRVRDIDLQNGSFEVIGKGNKRRMCYLGRRTSKSVMSYLRKAKLPADAPLFPNTKRGDSQPMARSGLLCLIKRLGKVAGVSANVHQFRRTFATSMLEAGADIVSVRDMLGHTNIQMTLKYLSVAESHVEAQHRKFSPGDRLNARV